MSNYRHLMHYVSQSVVDNCMSLVANSETKPLLLHLHQSNPKDIPMTVTDFH